MRVNELLPKASLASPPMLRDGESPKAVEEAVAGLPSAGSLGADQAEGEDVRGRYVPPTCERTCWSWTLLAGLWALSGMPAQ